eukprot:9617942-Lingulodinium_polyedra.AAC.1
MLVGPVAPGRLPASTGRRARAPVVLGAAPLRQAAARVGEAPRPCPGGVFRRPYWHGRGCPRARAVRCRPRGLGAQCRVRRTAAVDQRQGQGQGRQ